MAGATKPPAKAAGRKPVKTQKRKAIKNPFLALGVRKFSKAKMMKNTGAWKFVKDPVEVAKTKATEAPKKAEVKFVVKKIGGAKNGGERKILLQKPRKFYPTENTTKVVKKASKPRTYRAARASITPGTILILLAGRHRGRRVVYLKQLASGFLLVTGPYKLNSCPLRRINQNFVIATSTKIDITGVKVPENVKDEFFAKPKKVVKRGNTAKGGDLFEKKKVEYAPSEERKKLQLDLDKQILAAVKKHPEAEVMQNYLKIPFGLSSRTYPHALKF